MTARVTVDEMDGVTHHLVNYLDAAEEPSNFVDSALRCIEQIQARGKIPFLCGGSTSLTRPLLLHQSLAHQKRYVIAMVSSMTTLGDLLDSRISKMCQEGLLEEVQELLQLEKRLLTGPDFSCGIWKSIGYPELRPWYAIVIYFSLFWRVFPRFLKKTLSLLPRHCSLGRLLTSIAYRAEEAGPRDHLLKTGLCAMKKNTRAYAEKQLTWMLEELLESLKQEDIEFRVLRLYDPSRFEHEMEVPAVEQCNDWLFGVFKSLLNPSPMISTGINEGLVLGNSRM